MLITSLDNPQIKELIKLKCDKSYRDKENKYIVEGYHMVRLAYEKNLLIKCYSLNDDEELKPILINEKVLKKVSSVITPQGIIGIVKKDSIKNLTNKILYLDHIQDPGNMGTLLRTALAFGFKTIINDSSVDYYNEKVLRSTQGAIFSLNLLEGSIDDFDLKNYYIYSTDLKGKEIQKIEKKEKVVLILGNEGSGVREELKKRADQNLKISIDEIESLNVSIAGGILMYELK